MGRNCQDNFTYMCFTFCCITICTISWKFRIFYKIASGLFFPSSISKIFNLKAMQLSQLKYASYQFSAFLSRWFWWFKFFIDFGVNTFRLNIDIPNRCFIMIFSKSNPLRLKFHWFLSKTECGYVVNLLQPFRFDLISNTWFILTGGTTIMTLICDQLGIITDNAALDLECDVSMEKERRGEATTVQSNWHCEWLVDGYPLGAWTFKLWLCECVCDML